MLLHCVGPDLAIFGEKDYQQLVLVRRMVADLGLRVTVVGVPVVRDPDGVALSSRNRYLDADERRVALALPDALQAGVRLSAQGPEDYLVVRDLDLGPAPARGPARLLVAARVGTTRLLDNVPLELGG